MLSRVAENIYWLARYLERAEDTARLISVNSHLLLDFPEAAKLGWSSLITINGSEAEFARLYGTPDQKNVLAFLCADKRHYGSIISSLAAARENLRTTRDIMPNRVWEEINQLYFNINALIESGINSKNRDKFLSQVIRSCQTVNGMVDGTLSYTQTRTFLMLGRFIERADMTTRIIDVRSSNLLPKHSNEHTPFETLQWVSVLKSLTALQMYRQHVRLKVRGPDVLSFLLQDRQFPRSIACCIDKIIQESALLPAASATVQDANSCLDHLMQAKISLMAAEPSQLHQYIDDLQINLSQLHQQIADTWFNLVAENKALEQLQELSE